MRTVRLLVLCACSSSPKHVDPIPLPPEGDQPVPQDAAPPQDISKWPAFPTLGGPPASHPTGDPIVLPAYSPKAGDAYRQKADSSFEQHYSHGTSTRFQRTDTHFDLDVRVIAVEADHPKKVEVAVTTAHETIALADAPTTTPREDEDLLIGTYVIGPGPGGGFERDEAVVTRGGGVRVEGREQEELGGLFGVTLREGDSVTRLVRSKQLRLGEVVALTDADKHRIVGDPVEGTYSLSVAAADAKTVTYQIDVVATTTRDKTTTDMHMAATIKFDRATARVLELRNQLHKTEHYEDSIDDTFSTDTTTFTFH
jgi:hypothetical protein